MPSTMRPIDGNVFSGLGRGDEDSLQQLFRDYYSLLTDEIGKEVDDPQSAPRIVEGAFRRAWAERGRFETPEALERFLHEAVHDGAVRERSRRAAVHRFESNARVHVRARTATTESTSVDDAWEHVASALHGADAGTRARIRAASRHQAAEHLAAVAKRRWRIASVATAAFLAAAVCGSIWWLDHVSADAAIEKALASPDARVLSTKRGQQAVVTLLDGTTVALGADSKLHIPPGFGSDLRAVKLEGTAIFTVSPGQPKPFEVRAAKSAITAVGTVFGVYRYPTDTLVTVGVREGQVVVQAGKESRTLAAGAALTIDTSGTMRELAAPGLEDAFGWAEGRFTIVGRPLHEALPRFLRWYGLDVKVKDPALLDRMVTVRAGIASSADAIAALEASAGLKVGYEGKVMVLHDASRAPKKTR